MADSDLIYNPFTMTMTTRAERERWADYYAELGFMRRPAQGEIACPHVIRDNIGGIHGLQGQHDGNYYDSKRALRRSYREHGMVEVGDDPVVTDRATIAAYNRDRKDRQRRETKEARRQAIDDSIEKAYSRINLTSYRKDEIR